MAGKMAGDPARDQEALVAQPPGEGGFREHIKVAEFAGGMEQHRARFPQIRIGSRWYSTLWPLIGLTIAGLVVVIAICQQLRHYEWMQSFIDTYPGTATTFAPAVESGFPAWLRWQQPI